MTTGFDTSPGLHPWRGARDGSRQDRLGSLRRRTTRVVGDVVELLGRSMVYLLAMLGLLHLLGLVAVAPWPGA
jgi:hypothetical protein